MSASVGRQKNALKTSEDAGRQPRRSLDAVQSPQRTVTAHTERPWPSAAGACPGKFVQAAPVSCVCGPPAARTDNCVPGGNSNESTGSKTFEYRGVTLPPLPIPQEPPQWWFISANYFTASKPNVCVLDPYTGRGEETSQQQLSGLHLLGLQRVEGVRVPRVGPGARTGEGSR